MNIIFAVIECDRLDSAKEVDEHYAWSSCGRHVRRETQTKQRNAKKSPRWQLCPRATVDAQQEVKIASFGDSSHAYHKRAIPTRAPLMSKKISASWRTLREVIKVLDR